MIRSLLSLSLLPLFFSSYVLAQDVSSIDKMIVVKAVMAHLEKDYVDQVVGSEAAKSFRKSLDSGAFDTKSSGAGFAESLSEMLKTLTGDGHLNVEYSEKQLPNTKAGITQFSAGEMERWYGAEVNFGVEQVARLSGNIGLIDLRVFAPIAMGAETVAAAMNVVAHMDALVIDLRNNGGGIGDMANLVASYLFDNEPQPLTGLYDRPSDTFTQQFTQAYVPGARFGKLKPVYVLISRKTFSAAEALAYNLQALGRAVVVGEASGGGAHPFEYVRIHPHFVLWSVTAKSINPITGGNWQRIGVQPDIIIDADHALDLAVRKIKDLEKAAKPSEKESS